MHACAGLPELLLGQRIVAHPALDPAARLALFRSCHGLARLVLMHAPGSSKRVTHKVSSSSGGAWSATLAHLFGVKWQPLPQEQLDLELRVESTIWLAIPAPQPRLPPPPPSSITHHISRLQLLQLTLTPADLAAWQLHDPARWPHLQHLTVSWCTLPPVGPIPPPLPPIPRLLTFSWGGEWSQDVQTLLPLAANATHAHMPGTCVALGASVVERLPHLTHVRLRGDLDNLALRALLRHPTLAHVTVEGGLLHAEDLSQQPCRWRTLSTMRGLGLVHLARLPVAGLERLTIARGLDGWSRIDMKPALAAGVAALQRLHGEGRLVLLPDGNATAAMPEWMPAPGDGMFRLRGFDQWSVAVLRLVVEAGPGVNTLVLPSRALPLPLLREQVAPMLQQRGATIRTLCVELEGDVTEEWCSGFLGALPTSVAHVKVWVKPSPSVNNLVITMLVWGGMQVRRHPLWLTLLHRGAVEALLEAALRRMVAGGGGGEEGGAAGQQQQQEGAVLLTLEVVQAPAPM